MLQTTIRMLNRVKQHSGTARWATLTKLLGLSKDELGGADMGLHLTHSIILLKLLF
jgi:hypothetical protein